METMNKKELVMRRKKTLNQYGIQGNYFARRAKNAIYFSPANSWKHEMKKAEICYNLLKEKKQFITEAWHRRAKLRRDIVCLDDHTIYEIETDPKRAERFKSDPMAEQIEVVLVDDDKSEGKENNM